MKIRKGLVYFVCRDKEQLRYVFEKIKEELKPYIQRCHMSCGYGEMLVNEYKLLFKTNYSDSDRGYRPEIVYIDYKSKILIQHIHTVVQIKNLYSIREESIRYLDFYNDFNYIDLKELIDDKYAIQCKIDKEKLKRYNERHY